MVNTVPAYVVVHPFGGHDVGDIIADAEEMKAILGTEAEHKVVRSSVPVADEPATKPGAEMQNGAHASE